ncbi:MAG: hypothetical protein KA371_09120 [Acidobacteria bacterium]|nr:hypothetical protein [Acidobacteriota bacterium]
MANGKKNGNKAHSARLLALAIAVGLTATESLTNAQGSPALALDVPSIGGQFSFSELTISSKGDLGGRVRNATSHDWFLANFEFAFLDRNGKRVGPREPAEVVVIGIKAGETADLEDFVSGIDGRKVAKIDVKFMPTSRMDPRFTFRIIKPEPSDSVLSLKTDWVFLQFVINRDHFAFSLKNLAADPLQLDWNSASFVDMDGIAHRVLHTGTKLIDRDKTQLPSVVPPGATIQETVSSIDSVQIDLGKLHVRPFLQVDEITAPRLKGKTFSILLPLVVAGKTENLFITFVVENVVL